MSHSRTPLRLSWRPIHDIAAHGEFFKIF